MLGGKVALVTGGAGGIGSAICRALASEGAGIAINFNTSGAAAGELVEELQSAGTACVPLQADITCAAAVYSMVTSCVDTLGRLDILVNNAGYTEIIPPDDLTALTDDLIDRTLKVKVHASLYCIRAARPYLRFGGPGHIVNITSVGGIVARGSSIIYAAANAALSNMSRSLARSLAPDIRVNAIAPGYVETGFARPKDGSMRDAVSRRNYIGRSVEPEEVAEVVRILCTKVPAMTGEEIVLDGGICRLWPRS